MGWISRVWRCRPTPSPAYPARPAFWRPPSWAPPSAALAAADGAVERTVLQRTELPGQPARVMVMTELTAEPGARIPRHTHPGTEMVYVLTAGRTRTDAGATREMDPGQTLRFDRGDVHGGFTVIGDLPVHALTIHVVDADTPMTTVVD